MAHNNNKIGAASLNREGSFLHVQNDGKAYVDNSTIGCGIIAPRNIGEPARTAGSLIFAHLR